MTSFSFLFTCTTIHAWQLILRRCVGADHCCPLIGEVMKGIYAVYKHDSVNTDTGDEMRSRDGYNFYVIMRRGIFSITLLPILVLCMLQ